MKEGKLLKNHAKRYLRLHDDIIKVAWHRLVDKFGPATASHYRCVQAEYQMRFTEWLLLAATNSARAADNFADERYFREHALEEAGHHTWGVNDLQWARNSSGTRLREECVHRAIKRMIDEQFAVATASQYRHFFGYIVALEGNPGSSREWREFAERNGLDIRGFYSPIRHAELDHYHADDLFLHIEAQYPQLHEQYEILQAAARCYRHIADSFLSPAIELGDRDVILQSAATS